MYDIHWIRKNNEISMFLCATMNYSFLTYINCTTCIQNSIKGWFKTQWNSFVKKHVNTYFHVSFPYFTIFRLQFFFAEESPWKLTSQRNLQFKFIYSFSNFWLCAGSSAHTISGYEKTVKPIMKIKSIGWLVLEGLLVLNRIHEILYPGWKTRLVTNLSFENGFQIIETL